ncbi:hypothetical protein [Sphingomonas sp. BK580]|uniref:hypothetical protein n=1 Tax=Sphingomonas sp. BK580 TaxID=2586972 RepID=UPI001619C9A1|nr:hypothetical protein [Sphingomonas sp. BK580]MBB3695693.1 hypothetical protein [Sphingomonas sp. BK580]
MIRLVVLMYVRFRLSLPNVEDLDEMYVKLIGHVTAGCPLTHVPSPSGSLLRVGGRD